MIEKLISENTIAIKELTQAIQAMLAAQQGSAHFTSHNTALPVAKMPVVEDKPKTLDYITDIQPRAVGLIKAGKRDKAIAILVHFGVGKFDQLPPGRFEEVLAMVAEAEKAE